MRPRRPQDADWSDAPRPAFEQPDADKQPATTGNGPDAEPPRSSRYVPGSANGQPAPVPVRLGLRRL